ncbi:MAG: METTL5 family protein [Thermoplasmata archaeon]|nr:METTL5 family protein [Thermoplasmata archaeon]
MRRSELIRLLSQVPGFPTPDPKLEQVATPPERGADLLFEALARGDLEGRSVVDLGSGTGRLAIGASLLGSPRVEGIEADLAALSVARTAAETAGATVTWTHRSVEGWDSEADTVVMNPPFGAQTRGADRPFWDAALARPRVVYAFALADSRTFIARLTVARRARVEAQRPVPWTLGPTFRHHRKRSVELPVDLWVIRSQGPPA